MALLAQCRPDGTDPVTVYHVPQNRTLRVQRIYVSNNTGSAAAATIYVDAEAVEDQNFDEDTAIIEAHSVAANDSLDIECGWTLQGGGTIGVVSGTASALTFTLFGELF